MPWVPYGGDDLKDMVHTVCKDIIKGVPIRKFCIDGRIQMDISVAAGEIRLQVGKEGAASWQGRGDSKKYTNQALPFPE